MPAFERCDDEQQPTSDRWYWNRNSVDAALTKSAEDVERLCDEIERLRAK